MNDKVVFLAFTNKLAEPDVRDLIACKACRNKAFALVHQGVERFPMLECTACHAHIGRVGWAEETT